MCEWEVEREKDGERGLLSSERELKTPTTPVAYINQYSDWNLHIV